MQPPLLANELNPEVILAAQIVLVLFVLIITLLLAFPRIQQVMSVLELIAEVVGSLASFVVQLIRFIHICSRIRSIGTARQPAFVGNGHQDDIPLANTGITTLAMAQDRIQQVLSDLELIAKVVGSLASFVDQLIRLIRVCIRTWSIWTAGQPAFVGNGHLQDDIPLAEADAANGQNGVIVNKDLNI